MVEWKSENQGSVYNSSTTYLGDLKHHTSKPAKVASWACLLYGPSHC